MFMVRAGGDDNEGYVRPVLCLSEVFSGGSGFGVEELGCRVKGLVFFRVWGSALGFRVHGL